MRSVGQALPDMFQHSSQAQPDLLLPFHPETSVKVRPLLLIIWSCVVGRASADELAKVDFARDVQPLFIAHCTECHGPQEQKNGFRLDRRRDALRGGTGTMIARGSAVTSRLYLKLIGDQYGPQMPPAAELAQEEIDIIKTWIDQGAPWPDELAGETPPTITDPKAARMMDLLRDGNREAFRKQLRGDPAIATLTGPGGSTPLMYAVLYADADAVRLLLESGADPNVRNEGGVTALMWAVDDLEKTRVLLTSGAQVNARSSDGRTPLLIATGYYGAAPVVKLLLDDGADPSAKAASYRGPVTPLRQAAQLGDAEVLRMLLERGADMKTAGPFPLIAALNSRSEACVELLMKSAPAEALQQALLFVSPPFGSPRALGDSSLVRQLIDRGADVNAKDRAGRTLLMLSAHLDSMPVDTVKVLIADGAEVNATTPEGRTALDFARQRGQTPLVELLTKAGATAGSETSGRVLKPSPASTVREALARSIPLLQRADVTFFEKTSCVSCHHNSLTAMTVVKARKHGIEVDNQIAQRQLKNVASYIENWRERALQGMGIPGESNSINYTLLGMAVENYPPDEATDAMARFLKGQQSPEGYWRRVADRPPLGSSKFQITAVTLRALKVYGPKAQRPVYDKAVRLAAEWLKRTAPQTNEDRVFQLLGLAWAGGNDDVIQNAARELLALQRADGGWGQLPTMTSDAYATGQALVALNEAAGVPSTDPAYQRGVQYLLKTQLEDGSWHVKSRAIPFQPYFESGFPHGPDQWISAAATNWAAMALAPEAR